jgi:NAD(P)-dependent dehydrogenase (short-subunit alcohol dehydrogenase family)
MSKEIGVALVTGAGSGIGRQVALTLLRRGWKVAGVDRNQEGLEELGRLPAGERRGLVWAVADVTESSNLREEIGKLVRSLGPIDLVVACAGVAGETPAVGMQPEAIARIISINLIGVSNTIAAVLPGMLARRHGHIVAVSSLAGERGLPGQMGYCASKAGLNALMQSLWLDVKDHGIRVTTVSPGHTRTPQATCMYKDAYLMPVERTTAEILKAIDHGKRFHAFPWLLVRQMRLMRLLPMRLQEWLVARRLQRLKK